AAADVGICFYGVADEQGQSRRSVAAMAVAGTTINVHDLQLEDGFIHTVFVGESSVKFDDVSMEPRIRTLFAHCTGDGMPPVKHCLAIPIRSADRLLIGAMFFGYVQHDVFVAAD